MDEAAVVVDGNDRPVLTNGAAHSLGIVRGDRLASAELRDLTRQVRRDARVRQTEIELRRNDHTGPIAVRARVVAAGGSDVAIVVTDLTAARRLDAVRRDFVANISHELKTPVGAIMVLGEALTEAGDDPVAVRRFGERLQREGARLSGLVRELIELSRLEGAGEPLHLTAVSTRDVVSEAIEANRALADSRHIAMFLELDGDLVVPADRPQLVRALSNLINNAVSYSLDGSGVVVTVRAEDEAVSIAVTDRGVGIDPGEVPRLFERFYRVDPARSRATGGSGLGLAIVKHIVLNHGGEIAVSSTPGAGSTFTLRLPLTDTKNHESKEN
ncbi:MAG: two-component system, OmpR family, sensor histidine kinase SenX3 [Frankiaceae bacterium]|jgi:two-component system sensor histidine kinase SenX3|nr:two-component system, OmpR family, sensor histidine kinase SenX3 [Frankiaceae bacterium]MDQ1724078.1 two-component system, OmpR family, sensor histidine kinase SenX3 [Frankiaceae bacterium]